MFYDVKTFESSDNSVRKYVFAGRDVIAEAVLYRYPTYAERTVICCSTQSGCPVGCTFCGTGKRFVRNLNADEIIYQVTRSLEDADVDPFDIGKLQIMFMSMGEPMLNYIEVSGAIMMLHRKYPHADLLISTMGPENDYYEFFLGLSMACPKIGLQFSVHESTDEARNRLIPFRKKLTLEQIAKYGGRWWLQTGRMPFFNYCAHEANTSEDDADRLADLFSPDVWQATVSVVCEKDESIKAAHERQQELASGFMSKLMDRGFSVRVFNPAGQDDIGGGCGQLWYTQEWLKERKTING